MSHVIFGRPEFRRPNGSPFGLAQLLQTSFFIEMALLQEVEDDGLKRLCGHGSTLSYFATTTSLLRVSHEKRSNLARIFALDEKTLKGTSLAMFPHASWMIPMLRPISYVSP
jgi:hypothetical protein